MQQNRNLSIKIKSKQKLIFKLIKENQSNQSKKEGMTFGVQLTLYNSDPQECLQPNKEPTVNKHKKQPHTTQ